ncbi:hypothetical protein EJ06DRAFT_139160 [Trichodelitschia bisporula]|uniref:Uncharacterized protein n=1 Tax=Trichodelitschia bisporula TaxID=703511 RepID=A0A6G1HP72_9PEZI|nr:hypothetical protein EJ06DRAFT_139160 [Trichodelitschia bisporula]
MTSPAPSYTPHPYSDHDWSSTQATTPPVKKPDASPISYHPDIHSPGLESAYNTDQGKEVVPQEERPQAQGYGNPYTGPFPVEEPTERKRRTVCGISLMVLLLILAAFIILAVALGVGLGVGLGSKKHSSSSGSKSGTNGNTFNPAYLSKSGAFNGSGLAIASYSFGSGGYGVINVYFQHWSGQLRKMQLMSDGTWQGGDSTNIVATDARNATPISAVAYAMDNKATWHIFYIDHHNVIREKISDNTTNQWRDGPIGELGLKAMNDSNVGLQACWYGSFYGTADYVHSPIPGTGSNDTAQDSVIGMHLWYGREPTVLEEVTWTYNTTQWYRQDNFTANGHGGIGCFSWGKGSVSYLMLVNLDNEVQVSWKDLNTSVVATPQHPVNKWVNTSVSIPHAMPNTSLGFTNYFYTQLDDGTIGGYNISFGAENTHLVPGDSFKIPQKGIAGTHFSVTAIPNASGGDSLIVFNQVNGSDITENTRDLTSGQWAYASLPVPPM